MEDVTPNPNEPAAPLDDDGIAGLEAQVVEVLRTVYDPEIPINIYDLGLIYEVKAFADHTVFVRMTLTTPNCPAASFIPAQVEGRVRDLPDVADVRVQLTFDPPFTPDMMSEEARLTLGLM
jgi:FeS assembly SUF system protein